MKLSKISSGHGRNRCKDSTNVHVWSTVGWDVRWASDVGLLCVKQSEPTEASIGNAGKHRSSNQTWGLYESDTIKLYCSMSRIFKKRVLIRPVVMSRQAKQLLFILVACASLVVSAVGGCLCSHHGSEAEKPESSCHSTPHESESAKADRGNAEVDSLCVCAADVSPAVFNKSDRKEAGSQGHIAAASEIRLLDPVWSAVISEPAFYSDSGSFKNSFHRIGAPPRAPPHL